MFVHDSLNIKPILALLCMSLCACNGGGKAADPQALEPIPTGTITGSVFGHVDVRMYEYKEGKKGAEIPYGSPFVDYQGKFSTTLHVADQPILVEAADGSYTEDAGNEVVLLRDEKIWRAIINYKSGQTSKLAVNAWTTIATGLAEYKIKMGAPVALAVDAANAELSTMLGIDVIATLPRTPRYIMKAEPITPEIEYGYFIAAISQWASYAGTVSNDPAHTTYTSALLTQRAYDDIKYDGLLDGKDATGPITFGTISLSQTIYRHELAINLLQFAQRLFKVNGPNTNNLLPAATRLNDSTVAVFGGDPVMPLDATGPMITGISPAANAAVYGSAVQITAAVTDLIGVASVTFKLDDVLLETPSDLLSPVIMLDTTPYTDGPHSLKILATNIVGDATAVSRSILIYNKSTMITNVVPVAGTWVGQSMTASATVTDPIGIQSVAFFIESNFKGYAANPLAPSLVMNISTITDAPLNLRIVATNLAGNTKTSLTTLNFDNTLPVITATSPVNSSYLKASFTASATATDANLTATSFFIDGNPLGDAPDKFNASVLIDTTKYGDGAHTVAAVATDNANNKTTKLIPLFFDNAAPVITNMLPVANTVVGNETFNVSASVSDLAVESVIWYLDNHIHDTTSRLDTPGSFVVGAYLLAGPHTITVVITDKAGNVSSASTNIVSNCTGPDCGLYR